MPIDEEDPFKKLSDAEASKNHRTCGRSAYLRQAPPRNLERTAQQRSVPTIPSRIETTLIKGPRERLGFGCHSMRFDGGRGDMEVPGPGNYVASKSSHEDTAQEKVGIRGTGGFASRSRRFGSRSLPQMPVAGRGCPGPGAYDEMAALKQVKDQRDFNQVKSTGTFQSIRHAPIVSTKVPGPGHYESHNVNPTAKELSAATSAFNSVSQRGNGAPITDSAEVPGPGHYPMHGDGLGLPGDDMNSNWNFKDPTARRIARIHQDLPPADARVRSVLGEFGDQVGRKCGGADHLAKAPGPGAYELDRDAIWESRMQSGAGGSSAFLPGSKRTDWGPAELGLLPGPGGYNPKPEFLAPDRLTSATSAFNSVVERNKLLFPSAPGPCYYKPSLPEERTSFRLNLKKDWLK